MEDWKLHFWKFKTGIIQTIGCAGGNTVDSILQEP